MRFVIVTGMSGAGKSSVLKMLEDAGYFCVDNLPIQLIPKFAEIICNKSAKMDMVALGIDARSGEALDNVDTILDTLAGDGVPYEILFLDCNTQTLVKRYKETRRNHPLSERGRVEAGISLEREKLGFLKSKSNYIIDTSQLLIRELKSEIGKIFINNENYNNFFVTVLSFGFKYGIPPDSDLVFDVRFLPNPYYVETLRLKTGYDKEVYEYVLKSEEAYTFLEKLQDMIKFLIPNYIIEGKNQLVVSIGCTGGKHRSVTLANALCESIKDLNYGVKVEHRDIQKDNQRLGNT